MLDLIVRQSSEVNSIVMDCFAGSGSFFLRLQKMDVNLLAQINQMWH